MTPPKLHTDRDPDFVYVIYIAAAQQKVWNALTDGKTVRPWWGDTQHDSSFEPGDPIVYRRNGKVDVRGEILERDEPNRLTYTFHTEGPGPQHDEGPTIVTYELQPSGANTMLKIIHTNFKRDSRVRVGVSNGWPAILSSLKSVLEDVPAPYLPEWRNKA
ncbi:MAG: SRPBCC family protein [Hyphomonadaceae bacterium]